MALLGQFEALWRPLLAIPDPGKGPAHRPSFATLDPTTLFHQFEAATPAFSHKMTIYGLFRPFWGPMTKPGRLIAQTSYIRRFKPLKKFGKSFFKSVKVYRRILDLAV